MKRVLLFIALAAFAAVSAPSLLGQTARAAPESAPTPRTADGHPDLSGVWWPGNDLRVAPLNPAPLAAGRGGPGAPGAPGRGGPPPRRERFEDNYTDAAKTR